MLSHVFRKEAFVAQSVEQLTLNQLVDGSNPPEGTTFFAVLLASTAFLLTHNYIASSIDVEQSTEGVVAKPK